MKKIFTLALLAVFALVGCNPNDITNGQGEPSVPPVLSVTGVPAENLVAEGGEFVLNYAVENPVQDVVLEVQTEAAWLKVGEVTSDAVPFTYEENTEAEPREATITLAYTGAESVVVTVKQDAAAAPAYDVELALTEVGGAYFDAQYSEVPGSYNYNVILSNHKNVYDLYSGGVDLKPSSQYLSLDIFAGAQSANYSLTFKAPNGVYTLDAEATTAAGTLGTEYTCLYLVGEDNGVEEVFFASGTVTVTDALIDAVLTAEDGKTYHIQCPNNLVDNSQSWGLGAMPQSVTTLTGDLNVPFTGESEIYADPYGDYLVIGKNLWFLYVDDYESGDEFCIWLLVDPAKAGVAGTYTISSDLTKECALVGYPCAYTYGLVGSWWMHLDANWEPDAMAALVSGSVVLTEGEEGMGTVVINAVDDLGHKVTGTCNAPLTVAEAGGWSLNKLSTGAKMAKHAKMQLAPRKVKISSMIKK